MFLDMKPLVEKPIKKNTPRNTSSQFDKFTDYLLSKIIKDIDGNKCWGYESHRKKAMLEFYPLAFWRSKQIPVRPAIYELFIGKIPEGKRIVTTCKNIGCINPEHFDLKDYLSKEQEEEPEC